MLRLGIDDDALVRGTLSKLLSLEEGTEVAWTAPDGVKALELCGLANKTNRVDVVLMYMQMPKMDGIRATKEICDLDDPPAIVILSTFANDESLREALAAGTNGFLAKGDDLSKIVWYLQQVLSGNKAFSITPNKSWWMPFFILLSRLRLISYL